MSSRLCGDLLILDSSFEETVLFAQVEQRTAGCEPLTENSRFNIQGSQFHQSLNINRSDFFRLFLVSNDINTFLLSSNRLSRLRVMDNDINGFEIYGAAFAHHVVINYNRIEGDLFISYKSSGSDREGGIENIEINSNRIEGGVGFRDFPKETIPVTLDFRSNRVSSASEFCLPAGWHGRLLLDGSTYDGTLAIGLSPSWSETAASMESGREPPCYGPFFVDASRSVVNEFCRPLQQTSVPAAADPMSVPRDVAGRELVIVEFEATKVRTLKWHMPLHCVYRWSGFGLTYDLWDAPTQARSAFANLQGAWREGAFLAWRTVLATPNPASLDMMSQFLARRGAHGRSRALKVEATRLNLAPECPPNETLGACLIRILVARDDWSDPWYDRGWRAFMLVLLWPSGFGIAHERALFLLVGLFLLLSTVYAIYIASAHIARRKVMRLILSLRSVVPPKNTVRVELHSLLRAYILARRAHPEGSFSKAALQELIAQLIRIERKQPQLKRKLREVRSLLDRIGTSEVPGFDAIGREAHPRRFTALTYSIDTSTPFVDLGLHSRFRPAWWLMNDIVTLQQVLSWWFLLGFVTPGVLTALSPG